MYAVTLLLIMDMKYLTGLRRSLPAKIFMTISFVLRPHSSEIEAAWPLCAHWANNGNTSHTHIDTLEKNGNVLPI